jgi:ADP-L-glycero-D-manno-heptose 6-epimerase
MKKTRILITGHEGFIGRNFMAFFSKNPQFAVDGYEWQADERPQIRGYDWVIHLGAVADMTEPNTELVMSKNYDFSCWLFEQCQKYSVNLQYASSSSVYGDTKNFEESAPCKPQTPYAWSKYLFDRWVFSQQPRAFVQGFRYFNVYGKWMHLRGHRANAIVKWREEARDHKRITVWENAAQVKRDWTWVGDICQLQLDFINQVKGSGLWNVGSGLCHSFLDIAEYIAEQESVPIVTVPMPDAERLRFRGKTCADLKHLKATVGSRKWLNVYEWLDYEKC